MNAFALRMNVGGTSAPLPPIANSSMLRAAMEAEVERLLAALDAMDGDPDLEDDGCVEPSLGWSPTQALGSMDDREDEHDGREPEHSEPSLGSLNEPHDQRQWSAGGSWDLEGFPI